MDAPETADAAEEEAEAAAHRQQEAPPHDRAHLLADAAALAAYYRVHLADVASLADPADLAYTGQAAPRQMPPSARIAAVLAPLYAREGRPYLLFTRRSAALSRHSGEISFPGGSRDPLDTSLVATALRESYEELHLAPEAVEVLGALPGLYAAISNFHVTPIMGWLGEGLAPLAPNAAEVAEVIEVPVAALADPAIYHTEVWQRAGERHEVHFYDYGAYRIWGLTGHIVASFLALLPPT